MALLALGISVLIAGQAGASSLQAENGNGLALSGTIEARQTKLAAEVSARTVDVRVQKGDRVNTGDLVVKLDDSAIQLTLREAESAVRSEQAKLDQVLEAARPGNIALAESAIAQAQAEFESAKRALDDANRALASPQDLVAQLHAWEARVQGARGEVGQAEAALAAIKNQIIIAERDQSMSGKATYAALLKQREGAEAGLRAARVSLAGSERVLQLFRDMVKNPLELQAAQHTAANQAQVAESSLETARVELEIVHRTAQPEAVALAQAKLDAAKANLELARAQSKRYSITSPLSGTVVDRNVERGETTQPGRSLLTIADLRELEMTVYVPIQHLKSVRLGQDVVVRVPSIPGATFDGKVTFLAQEGEFKPANIYNSQERSEMVFSVKVAIPNNGSLKAGLPADVIFQ